jgi:hypothetical protein
MADKSLYGIRRVPDGYRVMKFDDWLNFECEYYIKLYRGKLLCDCPQSNKHECRHRDMVGIFHIAKRMDKGWFYDYNNRVWVEPIPVWG